jgi:uncharacterized protein YbaP (TraB family)
MRLCERLLLLFFAVLAPLAHAQAPIEEVLVTGEHPGPGLWKVSHGGHTLWILGTHAPLPARLTWRSQQVEWVMTEAQQVIGPYSAAISLRGGDPFATNGPPLRKVLPRKRYAQWRALKDKYIGENDEIERALPVTAALVLRSAAFERAGLTTADQIWRQIYELAERYGVPVSASHQLDKEIEWDARRDAKRAERVGVEFLISTMSSLEGDLRAARTRANAWATGDVEALRGQAAADRDLAYLYAGSWPFLEDAELEALLASADARWLAAAERALKRNDTTLAALPIFMLLREDGLVHSLRALGYEVQEPE